MHRILIVTADRGRMADFAGCLNARPELEIAWAADGGAAAAEVARRPPLAVVIDEGLTDTSGFDLVRRLLTIDARVYSAVVSARSPEAFHAAGEGLGILAQLPPRPGAADAEAFHARLCRLAGISAPPPG
jgi:DNA-binding response OmpR family regulator